MAIASLSAFAGSAAPLHAFALEHATGARVGANRLTFPVPATDGATIDRTNRLILIRYQGMVLACSLECPHKGTTLQWQPENARFLCPKHKSTFKPAGTRIEGKASRSLDRYAVKIEGGNVIVAHGVLLEAAQNAVAWVAAGARVA